MTPLLPRILTATGPDRALDAEIVVALNIRPEWLSKSDDELYLRRYNGGPIEVAIRTTHHKRSLGHPMLRDEDIPRFTGSIDAALTLLPESAYAHKLHSRDGQRVDDTPCTIWVFGFFDTAQLKGVDRARAELLPLNRLLPPSLLEQRIAVIATQFRWFESSDAATPALALCAAALTARQKGT